MSSVWVVRKSNIFGALVLFGWWIFWITDLVFNPPQTARDWGAWSVLPVFLSLVYVMGWYFSHNAEVDAEERKAQELSP